MRCVHALALLACAACGRGFFDPKPDCRPVDTPTPSVMFVQSNSDSAPSASYLGVRFPLPQIAGDTDIVSIAWQGAATIASVGDSSNSYVPAAAVSGNGTLQQAMYYAPSIAANDGGSNQVLVTLSTSVALLEVRVLEYRGLAPPPPDGFVVGNGDSALADTGNLVTMHPHTLLVAADVANGAATGSDPAYTLRMLTPNGFVVEDREVLAAGPYAAQVPFGAVTGWTIELVAFPVL